MNEFLAFDWPGNVRQLKNITQRILALKLDKVEGKIAREVLGINNQAWSDNISPISDYHFSEISSLKDVEFAFRKKYVIFVRDQSKSDAEAARKLGLAPPNFHRMCKELGLKH